ncbi:PREDICTED: neuropeptide FF receptor 2-like [Branchiostoma belcheri]|uniref:Neuropeptide FF receptor 2-like n=1 Tax=Branchiostoma belcheri TaxID=7741 RepID=A0A6P4XLA8_BRABE|nr:PREDICTED: neuropeptide FF receptor 2-like [Branchiostoma belcheri]
MDLNITYSSPPPNFTGDPSLEEWKQKPHVRYLLIIGYATVILLNVIGNPLVCLVVAMNKNMRNVTNLFIANVAVSDFLVGAICMPLTLVNNLKAGWVFGRVMCTVLPMIMGMTVTASVLTLVAIAVDRYLAVMRPTDDKISNKVTCVVIAGIWTAATAIMIPAGVMSEYKDEDGHPTCHENWYFVDSKQAYSISLFVFCYLIPLSAISGLYLRAGVRLYNRTVRRQPSPNDARNDRGSNVQKLGNKVRVFKMMVAVVVLFACLHLPMWIANLINDIAPPEKQGREVLYKYIYPIAHWLAYANSCMNPFVYAVLNRNFRQGFRRAFMPRRAPRELEAPKVTYKRAAVADQQDRVEVQCRLGQESPMDSRLLRPLPSPVTLEAVNHDSRPVTPPATLEVANHDCSPGDPNFLQDDNH